MRSPARLIVVLALVSLVAAACGAAATTLPAPTGTPTQAATDAPAPTVAATARPAPTPMPTTDGVGPEYVTGTSSLSVTKEATQKVVGNVVQYRDQEMTDTGPMSDPRLAGSSVITLNGDMYGDVMSEWGTTRIENADGAWEGTWTGASWNGGTATSVSGWLVGSGAYEGYTYYFHGYGSSPPYQMEGIIFEGTPPTP
jgi:hypothetical protein